MKLNPEQAARHADLTAKRRRLIAVAASGAPGCTAAREEVKTLTTALLKLEAGRG